MKHSLLASAAAVALLTSINAVSAQAPGGKGDAPAAGQSRPDSAAPAKPDTAAPSKAQTAPASPQKGAETRPMSPGAGAAQNGSAPGGTAATQEKSSPSNASPSPGRAENRDSARPGTASPGAASNETKSPERNAAPGAATNSNAQPSGNRTASIAAPPTEKRSQILTTFKQEKVDEIKNVNFSLTVGTVVPSNVRYRPLPRRIVEIYPEWNGFDFIFVNGRYVVLRPQTHEIVYILEG